MQITVIGTGYVGTVTGACLSYLGHHVTCVDTDAAKIAKLKRGESPIYEPYLMEIVELAARRGGIEFSTEVGPAAAASDVIFIAVGTPPLPTGEPNLEYLEAAARSIGAASSPANRGKEAERHRSTSQNRRSSPALSSSLYLSATVTSGLQKS